MLYESVSMCKKLNFSVFLVCLSLFSALWVTVESTQMNPISSRALLCMVNCASKTCKNDHEVRAK